MMGRTELERRLDRMERIIKAQSDFLAMILQRLSGAREIETAPSVDLAAYREAIKVASLNRGKALKAYLKSGKGVPPRKTADGGPMTADR